MVAHDTLKAFHKENSGPASRIHYAGLMAKALDGQCMGQYKIRKRRGRVVSAVVFDLNPAGLSSVFRVKELFMDVPDELNGNYVKLVRP